jgi:hypothetical protein
MASTDLTRPHQSPLNAMRRELRALKVRRRGRKQPYRVIHKELVGLAFSGGGIRSATFGLGVLEELKNRELLDKVDYLSTVSGGGYIGAWLTANCRQAARRSANPPPPQIADDPEASAMYAEASRDWLAPRTNWKHSIAHLRRYSNYLAPHLGIFSADAWSMLAIWLRNTMLVQLTVILAIAALLVLPRPLHRLFLYWPTSDQLRWISVVLFVIAVAGIAANLWQVSRSKPVPFLERSNWRRGLCYAVIGAALTWLICWGVPFDPFTNQAINPAIAGAVALLVVLTGFCLLPVGAMLATPIANLVKRLFPTWSGNDNPERINYGQGWTQSLVVVPIMATGVLYSAVLWGLSTLGKPNDGLRAVHTYSQFFMQAIHYWPFPLATVFMSLWLLSVFSWRFSPRSTTSATPSLGSIAAALLVPIPAVVALHAMLCGVLLLMHGWANPAIGPAEHGQWQAMVWGPAMVLYAFSLAIVVLLGMMGRQTTEGVREWWARLGAWFLIYGAAWMVVMVSAVYGPLWMAMLFDSGDWKGWSAVGSWALATGGGLMAGKSDTTGRQKRQPQQATPSTMAKNAVALVAPYVFIVGLLVGVATLLHLVLAYLAAADGEECCGWVALQVHHWARLSDPRIGLDLLAMMFGGLAGVALLLAWRVDINIFSLNAFYRGRLVRCYLGAARFVPMERTPQKFTQFDDDDDLDMQDPDWNRNLAAYHSGAPMPVPPGPLHIVNCALNLGGSSDLALHTRHADNFILTPYSVGSSYKSRSRGKGTTLGYRPVGEYYGAPAKPKLGQAIAVSGAAASPNMGSHTSTAVAFLLTLFNVRLGSWFPNPAKDDVTAPSPWLSLRYLVKELFGGADDKSNYLMISDGGHFENLAAYELVRRRCRLVIISDAECDRELKFEGLGSLIRMCEVDFGATITLDVGRILGDVKSEWSDERYAVGSIDYGPAAPPGVLIYLKASMTGNEDSAVLQYKASHDAFPHESTGDQFYGEDQFESYRRLGKDIAASLFKQLDLKLDVIAAAEALLAEEQARRQPKPRPELVASGGQRAA